MKSFALAAIAGVVTSKFGSYGSHYGGATFPSYFGSKFNQHPYHGHAHHDHEDTHEEEEQEEPEVDVEMIAMTFEGLKTRIDELEAGKLLNDYFIVNGQAVHLDITRNMSVLAGPWCLTAGQTMELDLSVTLEELEDTIIGMVLIREYEEPVAIARLKDSQGPSALSLLYRETAADEDLTFALYFVIDQVVEPTVEESHHHGWESYFKPRVVYPEYDIKAENIQLGIKIFDEGRLPVSDTISDVCPPPPAVACGLGFPSEAEGVIDGEGVCQCPDGFIYIEQDGLE